MTKHAFLAYAFRDEKRYLRRHLVKPRSMKLRSFISRQQELNAYLEEFLLDTEGQDTAPLSADEIMDIIYHSILATWKNSDSKDFYETRVDNLESKEDKKKSSAGAKISKKSHKKREMEDPNSSVVESSKDSIKARRTNKKYCILHGKCSHFTDNCKDQRAMFSKHKQNLFFELWKEQQEAKKKRSY